jgi:hypothetical protein
VRCASLPTHAIAEGLVEKGRKQAWRSFYYEGAPEAPHPVLLPGRVALLVIDVQNTYLRREDPATLEGEALARWHRWTPPATSACMAW